MRRASLIAVALLAGCTGDLPSVSVIDKLRLLAVQAEPPEAAPGETVALDALVVEPLVQSIDGGPTSVVSALWLACNPPPDSTGTETPCALPGLDGGVLALPPDCADLPKGADAPVCLIAQTRGAALGARYTPDASSLGANGAGTIAVTLAVSDGADGALGCLVSAAANGGVPSPPSAIDRCVLAVKRLAVSDPARRATPPNHNPSLDAFTLSDASGDLGYPVDEDDQLAFRDDAGQVAGLDGGASYVVSPPQNPPRLQLAATRAPDAAEMEPVTDASGQTTGWRYEPLTLSWFTTAGSIDASRTLLAPPGCDTAMACPQVPPELATGALWTAPAAAALAATVPPDGTVDFWVVLRDDRGGVSWLAGRALPRP